MEHPPSVIDKAKRLEQLLLRVGQGESLKQVRAELKVRVTQPQLVQLQAKYEAGGRSWEALIEKRYGHPKKAHAALREWLYERKRQADTLTATQLVEEVEQHFEVELSAGHINYLLRQLELSGPPGRPRRRTAAEADVPASEASEDNAGIFFPGSRQTSHEHQPSG
jgi:transposase